MMGKPFHRVALLLQAGIGDDFACERLLKVLSYSDVTSASAEDLAVRALRVVSHNSTLIDWRLGRELAQAFQTVYLQISDHRVRQRHLAELAEMTHESGERGAVFLSTMVAGSIPMVDALTNSELLRLARSKYPQAAWQMARYSGHLQGLGNVSKSTIEAFIEGEGNPWVIRKALIAQLQKTGGSRTEAFKTLSVMSKFNKQEILDPR